MNPCLELDKVPTKVLLHEPLCGETLLMCTYVNSSLEIDSPCLSFSRIRSNQCNTCMVVRHNCTPHNSKTVVIISLQALHSPATTPVQYATAICLQKYLRTICNTAFLNQHKKHDPKVVAPHTFALVALLVPLSASACGGGGSKGRPGTGRPTSTRIGRRLGKSSLPPRAANLWGRV